MTALVPIVLAMHRRMRPGRSPESGDLSNWTNEKGARHAVGDWARAWPGAFANNEEKIKRVDLYVDLLDAHPWITASCWRDTVEWLKWNHSTDFLPNPARIIEVAKEMSRAEESKVRSEARLRELVEQPEPEALPTPAEYGNVLKMLRGEADAGLERIPPPSGLRAAIAIGSWDRGSAKARARGVLRDNVFATLLADRIAALSPEEAVRKGALSSARSAAGLDLANVSIPAPTTFEIDEELRRMDGQRLLKGPLDQALRCRLPLENDPR